MPQNWKNASICAAATTFIGLLGLMIPPVGSWFERLSFDLPCVFAPPAALNNVIIVVRDQKSYTELKQVYGKLWSRTNYVNLLERLTADQARLAVFDVFMSDPSEPQEDILLADAIRRNGRTVLAMDFQEYDTLVGTEPIYPYESFKDASLGLGLGVCFRDPADGVVRRLYPGTKNNLSLAWAAAQAAGMPTNQWAVRTNEALWLNYPSSMEQIRRISFSDVLSQTSGFFSNKIVFIGGLPRVRLEGEQVDEVDTPFSRWGAERQPGVIIQAVSFLNLIRGNWLQRFSPISELLTIILLGVLCAIGFTSLRPWLGALVATALAVILYAGACVLMFQVHRWYSWMIVVGVQIPFAFGWAAIAQGRKLAREKDLVARQLALERDAVERLLPATESEAATIRSDVVEAASVSDGPDEAGMYSVPVQTAGMEAPTVLKGPRTLPPSVPDHKLIRIIGEGAYGQVWLARDIIGSYHAVKFVFRRTFNNEVPYEREFKGIHHFTPISRMHPGFVNILHVGRNDPGGYFLYIMELADDEVTGQTINPDSYSARTLNRIIRKTGRLTPAECVTLGLELSSALEFLHQRRLIHRDIKPSNVLFVHGHAKFADVGLVTQIETQRTEATYIGTEGYIAPEGPGTVIADIYSLGKVLYEATMGLDRMRFPDLPTTVVDGASPVLMQLNTIILKACEFNPRQRYQSAQQLNLDLKALRSVAEPK